MPFLHVERAIIDVLQDIRRAGMRIGLISNCSSEEIAAWDNSPRSLFDDVIFSFRVGLTKPDPRIIPRM